MFGTAHGSFYREWLVEGLVIEYLVVDWAVLYREVECVSEEIFYHILKQK